LLYTGLIEYQKGVREKTKIYGCVYKCNVCENLKTIIEEPPMEENIDSAVEDIPEEEKEKPEFKCLSNSFLKISPGVVLTEKIDNVIFKLDRAFEKNKVIRYVVSAVRTPDKQLNLIIQYAKAKGVRANFTEDDVDTKTDDGLYIWQETWSKLLQLGILINPPREAKCLYSYKHPSKGVVAAGTLIKPSPHFLGIAFDISATRNVPEPQIEGSLEKIVLIVQNAIIEDKTLGIYSYQVEREQECMHINAA